MDQVGRDICRAKSQLDLGLAVSRSLSGAWRESPQPANLLENELAAIVPLLCQSGAGALGWWRIRTSALAHSSAGDQLRQVYRKFRLSALIHEREIKQVLSLLSDAGIEPVLVKGWVMARLYPDRALRPYGDIDLCVPECQFAQVRRTLKRVETIAGPFVDLHAGFANIGGAAHPRARTDESWHELLERSHLVLLDDQPVRVLSPEDHLRILCLHLLRSGAWRPPWLCDVALAVESRSRNFDWNLCLGRDSLHADWVACTIGLAHHLLGARVDDTPVAERARRLPRWLVPALLRQWGRYRSQRATQSARPARPGLKKTALALGDLYRRGDNPVRSTARLRGQFDHWPRFPYQLAELFLRTTEFPKQLKLLVRQLSSP
jgi:hypothetical protein